MLTQLENLVDDNRLLLDLKVDSIPCNVKGTVKMHSWTDGSIVKNGPFASSWDIGRVVYSQDTGSHMLIAKQLKYMAEKKLTNSAPEEFEDYFLKTCRAEHKKVEATVKQIEKDRNEKWTYLFIFMTNWPLNSAKLNVKDLPTNTIIYCENNLNEYYSNVIHSRLLPWLEDPNIQYLLSNISLD